MPIIVQAVLFDLDGTLLDTAPDMARAANSVLAAYGMPALTAEQIHANTSYGARGLLRAGFGEHSDDAYIDKLRPQFLEQYSKRICEKTILYPGITALLDELNQRTIPWGIVTNKPRYLTEMLLPFFPPLKSTGSLVCGDTLSKAKPHPAPLLHAAKNLNCDPQRCLYIGDIENDIVAAKAAKMVSAVAGWGYIAPDIQPSTWDADQIFNKPDQILSLF